MATGEMTPVRFYWRPGCPFCFGLERELTRAGLALEKRNIWENPDDAAFVRSVANGNETVPTVAFGDTSFVNPPASQVLDLVRDQAPDLLPDDVPPSQPSLAERFVDRLR